MPKFFIENEPGENDERQHDDKAGKKAEKEKVEKFFVGGNREGRKKRGGHEDGEKEVDEIFVGFSRNE